MNLQTLAAVNRYPECNVFHVFPNDPRCHVNSPYCWCMPELERVDPETGVAVWNHRRAQ